MQKKSGFSSPLITAIIILLFTACSSPESSTPAIDTANEQKQITAMLDSLAKF